MQDLQVTVVADKYSNPDWIAADLIAQAEHDKFSQSILISNDIKLIKNINLIIKKQLSTLPKKKIAYNSLKDLDILYLPKITLKL